jgi:hypothetical protein
VADTQPYRNPVALLALLASFVPFVSSLAMAGLKAGIGPTTPLYWLAQTSMLSMALVVVGSGLGFAALARAEGRPDWRIYTAFALQVLSLAGFFWFLA